MEGLAAKNIHLEPKGNGEGLLDCLQRIKEKEEREKKEKDKKNAKDLDDEVKEYLENDFKTEENKPSLADKLLEALKKKDALEVWELIELNNKDIKTLKSFDKVDAEKENNKEKGCDCDYKFDSSPLFCRCICCGCCKGSRCRCVSCACCKGCPWNKQQKNKEKDNQEKMKWIEILSNPLFISVEWLWRRNDGFKCEERERETECRNVDIVQAALDDACLMEKIASYEHHYSREEYKSAAQAFETFATDIIERTASNEHYDLKIMDIEGNGCLLTEKPENFIQSLSLLKIAANKGRKKVCTLQFRFEQRIDR